MAKLIVSEMYIHALFCAARLKIATFGKIHCCTVIVQSQTNRNWDVYIVMPPVYSVLSKILISRPNSKLEISNNYSTCRPRPTA